MPKTAEQIAEEERQAAIAFGVEETPAGSGGTQTEAAKPVGTTEATPGNKAGEEQPEGDKAVETKTEAAATDTDDTKTDTGTTDGGDTDEDAVADDKSGNITGDGTVIEQPEGSGEDNPELPILGRFKTQKDLEEGYSNLLSQTGKQGNKIGVMKRALEEQGYTFDAEGNPTPPEKPKADTGTQQVTPVAPVSLIAAVPEWSVEASEGEAEDGSPLPVFRDNQGVWKDRYGNTYITPQQWSDFREADPQGYVVFRSEYVAKKVHNEERYNGTVRQKADQAISQGRQSVQQAIKEINLPALESHPDIVKAYDDAERIVRDSLSPEQQAQPHQFNLAFVLSLADRLPEIMKHIAKSASEATEQRITGQKKVIATSTGGGSPSTKSEKAKPVLTPEERKAAEAFGLTEDDL